MDRSVHARHHRRLPARRSVAPVRGIMLLALLLLATPAAALRCGTNVVSVGDPTLLLLRHCGQPTLTERFEERRPVIRYDAWGQPVTGLLDYDLVSYEIWTYNFGPRRFITRIRIEQGRIERIETEGYGY